MESPLHTSLLKYTVRRRQISLDEESTGRQDEVVTRSDSSAKSICHLSSPHGGEDSQQPEGKSMKSSQGSDKAQSSQQAAPDRQSDVPSQTDEPQVKSGVVIGSVNNVEMTAGKEHFIYMVYSDEAEWDSEADSAPESDTSTPNYKRGRHEAPTQQRDRTSVQNEATGPLVGLELEAVEQLKLDSAAQCGTPRRPPSVNILADSRISQWPVRDNICTTEYREGWSLRCWIAALRAETIRIRCHTVIFYFECVQHFEEVPNSRTVSRHYVNW